MGDYFQIQPQSGEKQNYKLQAESIDSSSQNSSFLKFKTSDSEQKENKQKLIQENYDNDEEQYVKQSFLLEGDNGMVQDMGTRQIFQLISRSLFVSLGAMFTGYNLGSYSFVQSTMDYVMVEGDQAFVDGLCNAIVTAGIGIGGLSANYVLSHVIKERRKFLYIADLFGLVSSLLQMMPYIYTIVPGRFFGGVSAGFNFFLCPVYIKEYVPLNWIGTCMSIYSNSVNIGVLLSYLLAFTLSENPQNNIPYIWRLNLGFPVIFVIIRSILIKTVYKQDTPSYYIQKNEEHRAVSALKDTHGQEQAQSQVRFHKSQLKINKKKQTSFRALFTKQMRRRTFQALFTSSTEALTGLMIYTAFSWMLYAKVVKQSVGVGLSVCQVGVQILGTTILGGKMIRKFGRKSIMLVILSINLLQQTGQTYAQYMLDNGNTGLLYEILTIGCIQLYYLCLGLGISCVSFLMVVDVVPQAGISLANSFMALFNSIYSFGFPILIQHIPMWQAMMIIAIFDFIVLVVFKLWIIESKDLTEQQLEERFYSSKKE